MYQPFIAMYNVTTNFFFRRLRIDHITGLQMCVILKLSVVANIRNQ
jgi:hypothetical protein